MPRPSKNAFQSSSGSQSVMTPFIFVKSDMTKEIVKKLVEDGYIKFNYSGDYHHIANDEEVMNISEIEARICVIKPTQEGR